MARSQWHILRDWGGFSNNNLRKRIKAASTIKAYGELLTALVQESRQKEIEAASTKFTQSIRGLDADKRVLRDEQLGAIGTIVTSIGGMWIESQKASALKTVVPIANLVF